MQYSRRVTDLIHSPIGSAHSLVDRRRAGPPLLDLSQAAPSFPPATAVSDRVAEVAREADGGAYAPQRGLPALREAFASDLGRAYAADLDADRILVTAGCNQAFCLVASALTDPGDEVILVSPYYFNHDMWLRLEGIGVRHVPVEADHLPDPERIASVVTDRTRAIVVVSPGNPTGVTIPAERLHCLAEVARRHDLALVIDETYRTYRPTTDPPHALFGRDDWTDVLVSLHSFSKDLAIPGYRVGAIVAGSPLLIEALKILDCVAISAPRIGQEAALAGLEHATTWRRDQVDRVAELQYRFEQVMQTQPGGFELVTAGAYFGWVRHRLDQPTGEVVRSLAVDHGVLVIPGTAFTENDRSMLRFSFANLTRAEIDMLPDRLAGGA